MEEGLWYIYVLIAEFFSVVRPGDCRGRLFFSSAQNAVSHRVGPSRENISYITLDSARVAGGSSLSLFFSLLDIGAITSLNLSEDEIAPLPELAWQNVFAPGAHLYYGIPKTPLAAGVGFQYGPALRSIENNVANIQNSGYRIQVGLMVDIPFYHAGIYAGKKN